ncbi:cytochrome c oxidase assembly factor 7 [Amia ocellicauda]|uniref:cytochrome c oxidase assembly factor 7 n=1 Tax=Amia ocellicauda TaxID=2972642 RepID=UPI0034639EDC
MAGLINFEDEKEVKQYLDNLGIEFSYQCHKEKDPEGCHRLADYLEGVKKNYEATAQILRQNCEQNSHSESCYRLGAYHVTGKGGVPRCLRSAFSCFQRSCEAGGRKSAEACHNVGLLAHDGRALQGGTGGGEGGEAAPMADAGLVRKYYERACSGGFAPSCFNLSALYITGAPGLGKDMARALDFALQACQLGHVWGCANASRMYKLGEGAARDDGRAEELKNRARELHGQQKESGLSFGD